MQRQAIEAIKRERRELQTNIREHRRKINELIDLNRVSQLWEGIMGNTTKDVKKETDEILILSKSYAKLGREIDDITKGKYDPTTGKRKLTPAESPFAATADEDKKATERWQEVLRDIGRFYMTETQQVSHTFREIQGKIDTVSGFRPTQREKAEQKPDPEKPNP